LSVYRPSEAKFYIMNDDVFVLNRHRSSVTESLKVISIPSVGMKGV
jgi:hypothetical protein